MQYCTALAIIVVAASGCQQANVYQPPPPAKIKVAKPLQQSVPIFQEETGETEPVQQVEIRARVRGFLEKIDFVEGDEVKADQILYLIERDQYKAAVDASEAAVAVAKVQLEEAGIEFTRQENLLKENATAKRNFDLAKAKRDASAASVKAAEAELEQSRIDLKYTEVRTPIGGRARKTLVKVGNLVGNGEATHLTTVVRYDPIYANFSISENALLEIWRQREKSPGGNKKQDDLSKVKVSLQREGDVGFPFIGHLDYADVAVDQSTGTYAIRAIFDNPENNILPGLFVRVRVHVGVRENALLVPEAAVGSDQAGDFVYIVNSENTVELRRVALGPSEQGLVVVDSGLEPDDSVVLEGIQRVRPGIQVDPQSATLPPLVFDAQKDEPGDGTPSKSAAAASNEPDNAPAGVPENAPVTPPASEDQPKAAPQNAAPNNEGGNEGSNDASERPASSAPAQQ